MTIIYALIARKDIILAEHALSSGNYTAITQHILEQIPEEEQDTKLTYVYDR
jgi:vesicle-associated membrane protein 7